MCMTQGKRPQGVSLQSVTWMEFYRKKAVPVYGRRMLYVCDSTVVPRESKT